MKLELICAKPTHVYSFDLEYILFASISLLTSSRLSSLTSPAVLCSSLLSLTILVEYFSISDPDCFFSDVSFNFGSN